LIHSGVIIEYFIDCINDVKIFQLTVKTPVFSSTYIIIIYL